MPEVLVATPLSGSVVTCPYTFQDGISIRELSRILWDDSVAKCSVSETELRDLKETKYWLCASKEAEHVYGSVCDDLQPKARNAMWALQIICPSGSKHNVFLDFAQTAQGYDNIGCQPSEVLWRTLIGLTTSAEKCGLAQDFEAVYYMVTRAFTEKIVRLQNPILLLEYGMKIGSPDLGTLMFVMALDMLMMAEGKPLFVERAGRFLHSQSYVFPPLTDRCLQPAVKVGDVLSDLFDLRNDVAHGKKIRKTSYREKYDLLDVNGSRINLVPYYYPYLMFDSGLFLLARSLRKVAVDNLFDEVSDNRKWKQRLRR